MDFQLNGNTNLLDGGTLAADPTLDSDVRLGFDNVEFVPEPATAGLVAAGMLLLLRRRQ